MNPYKCKVCGVLLDVYIEGEPICPRCWQRNQMTGEEIQAEEEIANYLAERQQAKRSVQNIAIQLSYSSPHPRSGADLGQWIEDAIGKAAERYNLSQSEQSSLDYWLNYYTQED